MGGMGEGVFGSWVEGLGCSDPVVMWFVAQRKNNYAWSQKMIYIALCDGGFQRHAPRRQMIGERSLNSATPYIHKPWYTYGKRSFPSILGE